MEFYRYEVVNYAVIDEFGEFASPRFPNPKIELRTYNLHKETPKGFWIGYGELLEGLRSYSKWVSKTAKKRYAYPSKEEALENLIKRKERQIKLLKAQLQESEIVLNTAKYMIENATPSPEKAA